MTIWDSETAGKYIFIVTDLYRFLELSFWEHFDQLCQFCHLVSSRGFIWAIPPGPFFSRSCCAANSSAVHSIVCEFPRLSRLVRCASSRHLSFAIFFFGMGPKHTLFRVLEPNSPCFPTFLQSSQSDHWPHRKPFVGPLPASA